MRFGEEFLEELKARIRPSDVIGRHVKLKRNGREYVALSPFTNEKSPSFFVNDEKGFYHCFSSGKHGDAITFLMEIEGLSFPEAVEKLANMAGMALPQVDPKAEERAKANKISINWMEEAQAFFVQSLKSARGAQARQYLTRRGLSSEECQRFGIGFAPDSFDAQKNTLSQKGAPIGTLIEVGLLIEPEDKSREPWDRFRNRIMFPIHDPRGRLVAFGGRAMEKGAKAKYLNSPETPLFHKGRTLYRYPEARKALAAPKNAARGLIVAEGYMDVIALAKAGFEHAVAPLGTALTEDQLDLLWRAGPEPIMCFDGDAAGLRAAYRSIERALPKLRPGQSLRFALLPEGQDPDDLIRDKGAPAMQTVFDKAIPLIDMLWQREVSAAPLDTPEARADLKDRIFGVLKQFEHDEIRNQYKTALLERFDREFGRRRQTGRSRTKSKFLSTEDKQAMGANALTAGRESRIIGAIFEWPELLGHVDQQLFALNFTTESAQKLQSGLLSYWRDTNSVEKSAMNAHIEREGLDKFLRKLRRNRKLTQAAMGGMDASLETRLALWQDEAHALMANIQRNSAREDTRSRLADTIRDDNAERLKRLMRSSRRVHE